MPPLPPSSTTTAATPSPPTAEPGIKRTRVQTQADSLARLKAILKARSVRLDALITLLPRKLARYDVACQMAQAARSSSSNRQEIYTTEQKVYAKRDNVLMCYEYTLHTEISTIRQAALYLEIPDTNTLEATLECVQSDWQEVERKTLFFCASSSFRDQMEQCIQTLSNIWLQLCDSMEQPGDGIERNEKTERRCQEDDQERRGQEDDQERRSQEDDQERQAATKRRKGQHGQEASTTRTVISSAMVAEFEQEILLRAMHETTHSAKSFSPRMHSVQCGHNPLSRHDRSQTQLHPPSSDPSAYVRDDCIESCPVCQHPLLPNERLGNLVCHNPHMPHAFPLMTNVASAIAFSDATAASTGGGGAGGYGSGMVVRNLLSIRDTAPETIVHSSSMLGYSTPHHSTAYESLTTLLRSSCTSGTNTSNRERPVPKSSGNPIVKKTQQSMHTQFCSKFRVFLCVPCTKRRNAQSHTIPPQMLSNMYTAIHQACKNRVLNSFDDLTVAHVYAFYKQLNPKFKETSGLRMTDLYTALTGKAAPCVTSEELQLILQVREMFDIKTRVLLKPEAQTVRRAKRKRNVGEVVSNTNMHTLHSMHHYAPFGRGNDATIIEEYNTTQQKTLTKFSWLLQAVAITSFLGMTHLTKHLPTLPERLRNRHARICITVLEEIRNELHLTIG